MIGGRLFGVTIGGRYTDTDPIDNPIMLLEYVKRNQDWSDNDGTALIRTGVADGSFDDESLSEIEALSIARQITNENQQWTESLSKSICETFYLISRQDNEGYECVEYLLNNSTPSDTIEMGDTVPGSIGRIIEPNAEDIFVEPFVNYGYDYAFSRFTNSLRIIGVADNSSWNSDLTPGFSSNDGESLWNKCRQNYVKYGRNEKIPDNLTNQYWIPDYDTALWKITKIIEYQSLKKFSFSIFYDTGRKWYPGKQIYVKFTNETNSQDILSTITGIRKDRNRNRVDLDLLLLTEIQPSFYFTRYQATDGASTKWQATDGASTKYQEAG